MHDGAVLPILHLNGYKIANPTVLARIGREELEHLMRGYGYHPYFVEGDDPETMHSLMAATLDKVVADIRRIQDDARTKGITTRPRWPMIVFKTPKGWTGPKVVDGVPVEGTYRAAPGAALRAAEVSRAPEDAGKLDAELPARKSFSIRMAGSCPSCRDWLPKASGGWGPTRTPTAEFCCAT